MYQGLYNGSRKHEADLTNVLARSKTCGVDKIIITGLTLEKSKEALSIAANYGKLNSLKILMEKYIYINPKLLFYSQISFSLLSVVTQLTVMKSRRVEIQMRI